MRVQFNAEKHKADIESGKLKVITRKGLPVNIFDWNLGLGDFPVVAQIKDLDGTIKVVGLYGGWEIKRWSGFRSFCSRR